MLLRRLGALCPSPDRDKRRKKWCLISINIFRVEPKITTLFREEIYKDVLCVPHSSLITFKVLQKADIYLVY